MSALSKLAHLIRQGARKRKYGNDPIPVSPEVLELLAELEGGGGTGDAAELAGALERSEAHRAAAETAGKERDAAQSEAAALRTELQELGRNVQAWRAELAALVGRPPSEEIGTIISLLSSVLK